MMTTCTWIVLTVDHADQESRPQEARKVPNVLHDNNFWPRRWPISNFWKPLNGPIAAVNFRHQRTSSSFRAADYAAHQNPHFVGSCHPRFCRSICECQTSFYLCCLDIHETVLGWGDPSNWDWSGHRNVHCYQNIRDPCLWIAMARRRDNVGSMDGHCNKYAIPLTHARSGACTRERLQPVMISWGMHVSDWNMA